MRKFFVLTMMLLMIWSTAHAEEIQPPTISVSGAGVVEVQPDCAIISVGVITREKNLSDVQSANARAAQSVIDSIAALGIERKDISTGSYNFNPVYRRTDDGKNILDGYKATNSVTIVVRDLRLVGKVIDAVLNHGANQIDGLRFDLRDKNSAQDEALRLAVLDARRKADVVASTLGKIIVGVRHVTINNSSVSSPQNFKMSRAMGNAADVDTPIEGGTLRISADVFVEFEISR